MSEVRKSVRQKDRIHSALGSAVNRRLGIHADELFAVKTEYGQSLTYAMDNRGCTVEQQATQPIRRYPNLVHAPREWYRAILRQPMSLVTHKYSAARDFMGDTVTEAAFRLWNEQNDGIVELRMHTDKKGARKYLVRQASAKERLGDAPHMPVREDAVLDILSDVVQQNNRLPVTAPQPMTSIEEACREFDALAPAATTVRHGSYVNFAHKSGVLSSDPRVVTPAAGTATVTLNHFERQYAEGGQPITDFNADIRSVQPLDNSSASFIATRLALTRDEIAHRPIATLQLGIQVSPHLEVGGADIDIDRRDELFNQSIADFSAPGVFVEAMRRNIAQILV